MEKFRLCVRIIFPMQRTRKGHEIFGIGDPDRSSLGMHILHHLITRPLGGRIGCTGEPGNGIGSDDTFPLNTENANVH